MWMEVAIILPYKRRMKNYAESLLVYQINPHIEVNNIVRCAD
jgi:hypothetical protein